MSIRVAIVGVGNCACALLQGLQYYKNQSDAFPGLLRPKVGRYGVKDIEVVAAFDVSEAKVGTYLHRAAVAPPNETYVFSDLPEYDVVVQRGPTLDGLGRYVSEEITESEKLPVNVVQALRDANAEVVVNYLPVGSQRAVEFYAGAAIQAGCAFVNCMPVFIASNPDWEAKFKAARLPVIGDDIKSQVGATIVNRVLAQLFRDRGVTLRNVMQLNVGGNMDFKNMLERDRLVSKKISKTQAVTAINPVAAEHIHVGPSDYVQFLSDRKWCYLRLEGEAFGGAPLNVELKLEVWDSPNSAGIVVDAIRCAKIGLDNGAAGALRPPSANFMKSPPTQFDDDEALRHLEHWLNHWGTEA